MNTTQLECFVSLCSTLNYVRTAEELGLTQPAVSRQIQSLEQELDTVLFVRTTRSVSLTQVGSRFLPEAEEMLRTYYHSREWIRGFQRNTHQILRIGYADGRVTELIGQLLARMTEEYGELSPQLIQDQTDANLRRLTAGQLDLLLGMKDANFSDSNVGFRKLYEDRFHVICRADHPLAVRCRDEGRTQVTEEELFPYRQVINIPEYLLKNHFSRGQHIVPVNEEMENVLCANAGEAYALVRAGIGYALLPGHLQSPEEEIVLLEWSGSPTAPFGFYYSLKAGKNKASIVYHFLKSLEKAGEER